MPKNRSLLTDEQWKHIAPLSLNLSTHPKVGALQRMIGSALRGFYGCCEVALDGVTSQMNSPHQVPVGGA